MGLFRSLSGQLLVEILSPDIPGLLAAITERGIPATDGKIGNELSVRFVISRKDWRKLAFLCKKRGEKLRILEYRGSFWLLKGLIRRRLLLAGVGFLVILTYFLPGRVLFTKVEGNLNVPTNRILEAVSESGIYFGASCREIRSESVKNALLEAVPELEWAGVNTYGCVAVISVREGTEHAKPQEEYGVSGIVADCDGVILSATATRGSCLCRTGQSVTKGQLLISGYTDLGLVVLGGHAEGEVFARTRREIRVVTPAAVSARLENGQESVKFALILGKKRINLWKGSGISGGSCGRMYEEYYITLPGGFRLPVSLVKETVVVSELESIPAQQETAEERMEDYAARYLQQHMISGQIVSQKRLFFAENGLLVMKGEYLCTEMIGRRRQEKIGE